ncbi:hypothetical protein [Alistipes sp.]|uniref:hypothetical protein n=1 Tax=Alistipes sp. TaxID=1872444 RepID=UPI003AB3D876
MVEDIPSCRLSCSLHCENREVLEWWLVSDWIAERLKREGEVILSGYECYWWGRQTSGQAVYMDAVIQKICSNG